MGSGWRVEINRAKLAHWLRNLFAWVAFVLFLALARIDLKPTWDEILWLIGPVVVFVGLCMLASLALAYLKMAWCLMGAGKAARRFRAGQQVDRRF